ncbi:MAG TPA: DUF1318 domain-containing protein [Woeseiaceae bacterium]|jgi:uncharacterized protein YdbL (DUF1318 family)|nr:DUF1318 domain-containing protein [Woeseiaceae bacterium]
MKKGTLVTLTIAAVMVAACVTINVYFPEAAAEQAADRIIDKVQGESAEGPTTWNNALEPGDSVPLFMVAARSLGSLLVADAHAQGNVDFDKPSPQKSALENSLKARFPRLKPYYDSGAVGMNERGLIEIRDRNLIPLKDRNTVLQLVAAQNKDWDALYAEIARLNGHPEWVDDIRRTFAGRWVVKASGGWYYKQGGAWKRK